MDEVTGCHRGEDVSDDPEARKQLREEAQRRRDQTGTYLAAEDRRTEGQRIAEFGTPFKPTSESITMPLSAYTFQWREDGFYRIFAPGEAEESMEEWTSWDPEDAAISGIFELTACKSTEPTWWLLYGQCRPGQRVTARRADHLDVPVTRLGYLWIAEWRSPAQLISINIDGEVTELNPNRPAYMPGARPPSAAPS